jgi:hypothetical protein
MKTHNTIKIKTENGSTLQVPLEKCGDREAATIFIDGIPHHIERMSRDLLCKEYRIDTDPDYIPKTDRANRCILVTPFSQK